MTGCLTFYYYFIIKGASSQFHLTEITMSFYKLPKETGCLTWIEFRDDIRKKALCWSEFDPEFKQLHVSNYYFTILTFLDIEPLYCCINTSTSTVIQHRHMPTLFIHFRSDKKNMARTHGKKKKKKKKLFGPRNSMSITFLHALFHLSD